MTEDQAIELARAAATRTADWPYHEYQPTPEEARDWMPHEWVVRAIMAATVPGEELADSEGSRAVEYLRRARRAEAALLELVALKDMKDRLHQLHEMGHGTDYDDYHRRQPLAWDAAREVLKRPNA